MNSIYKKLSIVCLAIILLVGCDDNDRIAIANTPADGSFILKSDIETLVLKKEGAYARTALTLSWDSLLYNVSTPVIYTVQFDSINGNFSNPIEDLVSTGKFAHTFTDSAMNVRALKMKLNPSTSGQIKVRLKSNLAYGKMLAYSNVITLSVTPYSVVSLMYPLPPAVYLQGDGVPSNWGYPIPENQKLIQLDEKGFGIVMNMEGGKEVNLLAQDNVWGDPAYRAVTSDEPLEGGNFAPFGSATTWGGFGIRIPDENAPYRLLVDFSIGKYSLTPSKAIVSVPDALYVQGDAVPSNWTYPVPDTQKFEKTAVGTFKLKIKLAGGKKIAFISSPDVWGDPAYKAVSSNEPVMGLMVASGSAITPAWDGYDIVVPETGSYVITVNFSTGSYLLMREK